jgi:hypothetical protein
MHVTALFLVVCLAGSALSECPKMEDVPIMHYDGQFTCARCYNGIGGDTELNSCNGCSQISTCG